MTITRQGETKDSLYNAERDVAQWLDRGALLPAVRSRTPLGAGFSGDIVSVLCARARHFALT